MKLFVLTSNIQPDIFIKADNMEEALTRFGTGFDRATFEGYINHPSFKVRQVTMVLLMNLTPEEFQINEDTSF